MPLAQIILRYDEGNKLEDLRILRKEQDSRLGEIVNGLAIQKWIDQAFCRAFMQVFAQSIRRTDEEGETRQINQIMLGTDGVTVLPTATHPARLAKFLELARDETMKSICAHLDRELVLSKGQREFLKSHVPSNTGAIDHWWMGNLKVRKQLRKTLASSTKLWADWAENNKRRWQSIEDDFLETLVRERIYAVEEVIGSPVPGDSGLAMRVLYSLWCLCCFPFLMFQVSAFSRMSAARSLWWNFASTTESCVQEHIRDAYDQKESQILGRSQSGPRLLEQNRLQLESDQSEIIWAELDRMWEQGREQLHRTLLAKTLKRCGKAQSELSSFTLSMLLQFLLSVTLFLMLMALMWAGILKRCLETFMLCWRVDCDGKEARGGRGGGEIENRGAEVESSLKF